MKSWAGTAVCQSDVTRDSWLVVLQVLIRNVVLGDLMRVHFFRLFIIGLLHACDRASLKDISFFDQFIDALRIRLHNPGQAF